MALFRDEYGEPIAWRIALAGGVAVAAAIAVAVAAFGPRAEAQGEAAPKEAQVAAATRQPEGEEETEGELDAWYAGVEGAELLGDLTDEESQALRECAEVFLPEGADGTDARLDVTVLRAPERTGDMLTCWLRVETDNDVWYVTCRHEGEAPWEIHDISRTPPEEGVEGHVLLSDTEALSLLMPEPVAAEVGRQMAASGLDGADDAWTTASSVTSEGGVTRLAVHVPVGTSEAAYDGVFEESFGMLELYPVEAEPREVR